MRITDGVDAEQVLGLEWGGRDVRELAWACVRALGTCKVTR